MTSLLRRFGTSQRSISARTFQCHARRFAHTPAEPRVHTMFEPVTSTWQYIVADAESRKAVIIDPVLDFDVDKNSIGTRSAESLLSLVKRNDYIVERLLETHVHADHLTASHFLKARLSTLQSLTPKVGIGAGIAQVQKTLAPRYNIPTSQLTDAFDETFSHNDSFALGSLQVKVLELPGHTPDHLGYAIGSNVFVGDSIFNPDVGSARTDFPNGSASALWTSMQSLLALPEHYRLFVGHDYPPDARDGNPRPWATVAEHKTRNKHVRSGTIEDEFVQWRMARDRCLGSPKLMHQSLQVNLMGGKLPAAENGAGGILSIPVTVSEELKGLTT